MTGKVIIIVTGGRNYDAVPELFRALDKFDAKHPVALLVEGASDDVTGPYKGVDYWSRQWAIARGKRHVQVHAQWKGQGRAAGPIRNKKMLDDFEPHYVVVFPGGNGTQSMVEIARKAKVKTVKAFDWMV